MARSPEQRMFDLIAAQQGELFALKVARALSWPIEPRERPQPAGSVPKV